MLGIYPNLSNEDYHAHDSISRSKLMDFAVSPYHYWAMHLNPERPEKKITDAMEFGTAFHTLILEPDLFVEKYAVYPPKILLKDAGEAAYRAYKATCEAFNTSGRIILNDADRLTLIGMAKALDAHPNARELIDGSTKEQSYFWKDKESGLIVKSRPDILHSNMIVDLKTCRDASPRGFQRAMVEGGYHIQGAMIQDAVQGIENRFIENVINICVETSYPYAIGIYIISEEALAVGREKYKGLLLDLSHCIVHNKWNTLEPQTIGLPAWST